MMKIIPLIKRHRASYGNDRRRTWDGSKSSSNIVNELKGNSIFGFGDNVQSWDGGRSTIDQEVDKDKMFERKRRFELYDAYEEQLDSGRVKKVKRYSDHVSSRGHGNLFQQFQDDKTHGRDRWYCAPSSGNGHYYNNRHGYNEDRYGNFGYDRSRHHSYYGNGDHKDSGYKHYKKHYRNY